MLAVNKFSAKIVLHPGIGYTSLNASSRLHMLCRNPAAVADSMPHRVVLLFVFFPKVNLGSGTPTCAVYRALAVRSGNLPCFYRMIIGWELACTAGPLHLLICHSSRISVFILHTSSEFILTGEAFVEHMHSCGVDAKLLPNQTGNFLACAERQAIDNLQAELS